MPNLSYIYLPNDEIDSYADHLQLYLIQEIMYLANLGFLYLPIVEIV